MMPKSNDYIRFDWAIKRILRGKAHLGVLEGLVTVLIGENFTILEMIVSDSNRENRLNYRDSIFG